SKQAEDALKILDPLISLMALQFSGENVLKPARDLLKNELSRADKGNGIEMVLKLHKKLQQQALDTLFEGSPVLMQKGYTKDTYNPYISIKAATAEEGAKLLAAGYTESDMLLQDPADPGEAKHIYSIRDGGLMPWLTGVTSHSGKRTSGTTVHAGL